MSVLFMTQTLKAMTWAKIGDFLNKKEIKFYKFNKTKFKTERSNPAQYLTMLFYLC